MSQKMITIKGLNTMPSSCGECPLLDKYSCCRITSRGCQFDVDERKREIHCPLVEGEEFNNED